MKLILLLLLIFDIKAVFLMNFLASLLATQTTQRRLAHTDIQWPDFTDYRHDAVKDPTTKSRESAASRKSFTYIATASKYIFQFVLYYSTIAKKYKI